MLRDKSSWLPQGAPAHQQTRALGSAASPASFRCTEWGSALAGAQSRKMALELTVRKVRQIYIDFQMRSCRSRKRLPPKKRLCSISLRFRCHLQIGFLEVRYDARHQRNCISRFNKSNAIVSFLLPLSRRHSRQLRSTCTDRAAAAERRNLESDSIGQNAAKVLPVLCKAFE